MCMCSHHNEHFHHNESNEPTVFAQAVAFDKAAIAKNMMNQENQKKIERTSERETQREMGQRKENESKCLKGCLIFYGKCYVIIFYEVDLCLFCV